MRIDIQATENWDFLNASFGSNFRVYKGLAHAIYELTVGSALFLRHKKSIATLKGMSPAFSAHLPFFYKEGFQILSKLPSEITSAIDFVNQLNKDTLCVVLFEDHPVTGELFPLIEEIDALLTEKRILSVRISHSAHWHQPLRLHAYSARICSVDENLALVEFGEKFKIPPVLSPHLSWDAKSIHQQYNQAKQNQFAQHELVSNFENKCHELNNQILPLLHQGQARLFDRAILHLKGVHGEYFCSQLSLPQQMCMTTNQCQWNSLKAFQGWWEPQPSNEVLRETVIIAAQALQDAQLPQKVATLYEHLLRQSSW